jgi:type II secretory pathway pseudopilin PulG
MISRRSVRGQALVESLVAMLVLGPLLIATLSLAQRQTAQQTAQSAAWAGAIAAHHGIDLAGLSATDDAVNGRVAVSLQRTAVPGAAETAEDIAFALLQPALAVGSGRLELARADARRATASVAPAQWLDSVWTIDGPDRGQRAELSVLVDDWAAPDAAAVWRRTSALSTAGRIDAWRSTLRWAIEPMRLFEPAIARLCLGRIDPDIVPMDRLPAIRPESVDLRTRPC